MSRLTTAVLGLGAALVCAAASAQIDARMLRHPDVSATQIAFVYAGDIWLVAEGGRRRRSASARPRGEESFPRFSPDGSLLAFSANYDGNPDIYVVPATGGVPTRVTHHPAPDRMLDWYPDGTTHPLRHVDDQRQGPLQPALQGAPRTAACRRSCRCPTASSARISPDGTTLAYMPHQRRFPHLEALPRRLDPDIWLFDLRDADARSNLTNDAANDAPADVARRRRSTSSPTATRTSAPTSGPRPRRRGKSRAGHALQGVRRALPGHRPVGHRLRERRAGSTCSTWPTEKSREVEVAGGDRPRHAASRARRTSPS